MPIVEQFEWADLWWDNADREGRRVLLIGDSVTRGYWPAVSAALQGICFVDRMTTSKGPDNPAFQYELDYFLRRPACIIRRFISITACMPLTCPPPITAAASGPL